MGSYLLILRRNQTRELGLPMEEMFSRFKNFTISLHEKGALRAVERLKPAAQGSTMRAQGTGGPYDGGEESVIGFYLVDAADHAAAQAIAGECPILLVGGSVEIRETEDFPKQ